MNFEISIEKADKIVIDFLSKNGFGDNIRIERNYMNDKVITEVWDEIYYQGKKVKRITHIDFNVILKELLNFIGIDAYYVATNLTPAGLSFIISTKHENIRGR